jgi:hypothetical protein
MIENSPAGPRRKTLQRGLIKSKQNFAVIQGFPLREYSMLQIRDAAG